MPHYGYIPKDYTPLEHLAVDIKYMPEGFDGFHFLIMATLVIKLAPFLSFRPKKRILKRTHVMDGLSETSPSTEDYSQACPVILAH